MHRLLKILMLTLCIGLSSCKINGTFQGLYSYYKKTAKVNPNLFINDNNAMCEVTADSRKIILRTGQSLKNCIKDYGKTVVFLWGPKCKSRICPSLDILQRRCKEKGLELFIVAEYYDNPLMTKEYDIERPISGIDTKYYRTNLTSKYTARFFSDLTGKELDKDYKRMWYFENGVFVKMVSEINDL